MPVSAEAPAGFPDPILEAIENHRKAHQAFEAAIRLHSVLDRELPAEKCRSSVDAWGETIVEPDDPRWVECERAVMRYMDAETDAAYALIDILPTTMTRVVALLRHAVDADTDGEECPRGMRSTDNSESRSWHHFLIANLAELLPELMAGRAACA